MNNIPLGYCQCGCGQRTPISNRNATLHGKRLYTKGKPLSYMKGHYIHKKKDDVEKFWLLVDKKSNDECWNWLGGISDNGYGAIDIDGKTISTHRFSYSISKGKIPEGLKVLHSCDNRGCVNPNHLFVGTAKDNTQDMISKGRLNPPIGERCGNAKVTKSQVLEIRELWKSGMKQKNIAPIYGLANAYISTIVNRKVWKHI